MLYPPKSRKHPLPSLKSLPIEQVQPISQNVIRQQTNISRRTYECFYSRSSIFYSLKERFTPQESHEFDHIAQIFSQHFHFLLNSTYQSVSKLPIKVFACGRCKQVFFRGVEYILHCADMGCRINHKRSTYFVYSTDTNTLAKNQDILAILRENLITPDQYIFFGRDFLYFADYSFKRTTFTQIKRKPQFKCARCKTGEGSTQSQQLFLKHCLGLCKSYNLPDNSHHLIIHENTQPLEEFVQDINNFCLNINILSLLQNQYIRLSENSQFSLPNSKMKPSQFYCSNCEENFKDSQQFLKHALFDCHSQPNISSTKIITKKACPVIMRPEPFYKDKCQLITSEFVKKQSANDKKSSEIIPKINERYQKIWKGHQKIYFCACCYNLYSDFELYIAHFSLTFCVADHKFNSHYLFDRDNLLLTTQKLQPYIEQSDVDHLYNFGNFGCSVINQIKLQNLVEVVDKKTGNYTVFSIPKYCGKCGLSKRMLKNEYIVHIMKKCKNRVHPNNSHQIFYKQKPIIVSEVTHFLKCAHYCLEVIKMVKDKRIQIEKNVNFISGQLFGLSSRVYCGKCRIWFQSYYECFHHYLTKCDGVNSENSSHFFHLLQFYGRRKFYLNAFDHLKYEGLWFNHFKKKINIPIQGFEKTQIFKSIVSEQSSDEREIKQIQRQIKLPRKSHPLEQKKMQKDLVQEEKPINEKSKVSENIEIVTENHETEQQYLQIYPNIAFNDEKNGDKSYHCGKCLLSFKKRQSFIDHVFACKNYSHPQSSHLILTQTKFNDCYWDDLIKLSNYKQFCDKNYPSYLEDHKNVICGCGATKILGLGMHFGNFHSGMVPKGSSHFMIRVKLPKHRKPVLIYLPIEPKPANENDLFVCPCKPLRKLTYRAFANHIVKRHEGKSPMFYMMIKN